MNHSANYSKLLNSLVFSATLLGLSVQAHAAEQLGVTGNSVVISNSGGGFNQTLSISTDGTGTVETATGIPDEATLAVPSFSFTLSENGVADEVKTFSGGIIIQDANSQRRLEIQVTTITMDFSGAGLVGNVPAQNAIVKGRKADGTIAVETTVATGITNFNGSTLSFDANEALNDIAAEGGNFATIINAFNTAGAEYGYDIVLKQTGGGAVEFGTNPGGSFTAFPNGDGDAEFILPGTDIDSTMDGGYVLGGLLQFSSSSSGGGGGGGGDDEVDVTDEVDAVTDAVNDLLIQPISAESASEYTTTIATVSAQITALRAKVTPGSTVSPAAALEAMTALKNLIQFAANVAESSFYEPSQRTQLLQGTIGAFISTVDLYVALVGTDLNTAQKQELRTGMVDSLISTLRVLIASKSSGLSDSALSDVSAIQIPNEDAQDVKDLVASLKDALSGLLAITDNIVDEDLTDAITDVSQEAVEILLSNIGAELGLTIDYTDDDATQLLLSENPTLLSRLFDAVAINVGESSGINVDTTRFALLSVGLESGPATALADELAAFVEPVGLTLGTLSASNVLSNALGTSSLSVDSITSALTAEIGGEDFILYLSSVSPAPPALPEGEFIQPDGSSLVIYEGYAFVLVPAPLSLVDFAGAIEAAGSGDFSTSMDSSGILRISDSASGVVFSSTLSSAELGSGTATSSLTFTTATGDPADPTYLVGAQYADGSTQDILPAIADSLFFQSVGNAGFQISVDRATGLIDIAGFQFRPDFFQTALTATDSLYLTNNADSSGVAYRAVDANSDGVTDYQVLTSTGVQTVYGLP